MVEPENPEMRASDADREAVAEKLRIAQAEGRLTLLEYDQRLRDAYASLTVGDLQRLTKDLPEPAPTTSTPVAKPSSAAQRRGDLRRRLPKEVQGFAQMAILLIGIWAVTSIAAGGLTFFWPMFPLGIWGAVLLGQLLFGDSDRGGAPHGGDHRGHRGGHRHRGSTPPPEGERDDGGDGENQR